MRTVQFLSITMACAITCGLLTGCKKDAGSTSTPPKTTGHVYATIAYNGPPNHIGDFSVDLFDANSNGDLASKTTKGNGTLDFGEWNPGTYEIDGEITIDDSTWVPKDRYGNGGFYYHQQHTDQCKKSFQVQANTDSKVALDNWY